MISGFFLKSTVVWLDNDLRVVFMGGSVVRMDNEPSNSCKRALP